MLLRLSTVHYLGTILRFPEAIAGSPLPGASASRAEAESLQKPFRSPASELAATFPAGPAVPWSPGGGGASQERGEPGTGWAVLPPGASRATGPAWSCSPGPARWLAPGPRSLLAWACPLSAGASTRGACLPDPSSSVRQGLGLPHSTAEETEVMDEATARATELPRGEGGLGTAFASCRAGFLIPRWGRHLLKLNSGLSVSYLRRQSRCGHGPCSAHTILFAAALPGLPPAALLSQWTLESTAL